MDNSPEFDRSSGKTMSVSLSSIESISMVFSAATLGEGRDSIPLICACAPEEVQRAGDTTAEDDASVKVKPGGGGSGGGVVEEEASRR